jgi:hypothetical protein
MNLGTSEFDKTNLEEEYKATDVPFVKEARCNCIAFK